MSIFTISKKDLEWAEDKNLLVYTVILTIFAYIALKQIFLPDWQSILDLANFGIHEIGHPAMIYLGNFMHALGGTLFEIGVPLAFVFVLYEQRMLFASAMSSIWLTTALYSVSVYASDAQARLIPLTSIFGPVDQSAHDWNYLLDKTGLLSHDQFVGQIFAVLGILAASYGIFRGIKLLFAVIARRSMENKKAQTKASKESKTLQSQHALKSKVPKMKNPWDK